MADWTEETPVLYALFWKEHYAASPKVQVYADLETARRYQTYLEGPRTSFDYREEHAGGGTRIAKFTGEWVE